MTKGPWTFAVVAVLATLLGACSASTGATPAASHQPPTRPIPSLGAGIWFAPLPFGSHPGGPAIYGSADYMDLFRPNAPWSHAAGQVRVFKLYATAIRLASDADLKSIITWLNRANMAIALEMGPLEASACGQGVEGFDGSDAPAMLRRIKEAGGTVRFIAMDEPYFFGSLFTGPSACQWPPQLVAHEIANFVSSAKLVFPDIVVGDIEPLSQATTTATYVDWIATYRSVTGAELPFFHLDLDFARPAWPQEAKQLETAARERGVKFGIIYIGNPDDTSDAAWSTHAAERMAAYEVSGGGQPDSAVFQSWENYPRHVLPETDPTTFTGLIDQYLGTRTTLTLQRGSTAAGGRQSIIGQLAEPSGKPVPDVAIDLVVTPLGGTGQFKDYTSSGTVPDEATRAVVGFRTNIEGAEPGPVDFYLYQASYREGNEASQRVPDANFSQGLASWGVAPSNRMRLQRSDRGAGWMLHVITGLGPSLIINSASFRVTPGASYAVSFGARLSQASRGYFTLIFLRQTEVSRVTLPFTPTTVSFPGKTDANGSVAWEVPSADLPAQVDAHYTGDARHWPAVARLANVAR